MEPRGRSRHTRWREKKLPPRTPSSSGTAGRSSATHDLAIGIANLDLRKRPRGESDAVEPCGVDRAAQVYRSDHDIRHSAAVIELERDDRDRLRTRP